MTVDHVCTVDDVMCMERWETIRARIESQVARGTYQGEWDPARPWGTVVSHTAYGSGLDASWWLNQMDKACMTSGNPTVMQQVPEGGPMGAATHHPVAPIAGEPRPPPRKEKPPSRISALSAAGEGPARGGRRGSPTLFCMVPRGQGLPVALPAGPGPHMRAVFGATPFHC